MDTFRSGLATTSGQLHYSVYAPPLPARRRRCSSCSPCPGSRCSRPTSWATRRGPTRARTQPRHFSTGSRCRPAGRGVLCMRAAGHRAALLPAAQPQAGRRLRVRSSGRSRSKTCTSTGSCSGSAGTSFCCCNCSAFLVMIYGVLGPRLHGAVLASGRHYILMIDHSASMSATDVPPNRLAWAKAEAIKEIDAATDADVGMVIVFNSTSPRSARATRRTGPPCGRPSRRSSRRKPADADRRGADPRGEPRQPGPQSTENAAAAPDNPEPGKERQYVNIEGMQADVHLYSDGQFPASPTSPWRTSTSTTTPPPTAPPEQGEQPRHPPAPRRARPRRPHADRGRTGPVSRTSARRTRRSSSGSRCNTPM